MELRTCNGIVDAMKLTRTKIGRRSPGERPDRVLYALVVERDGGAVFSALSAQSYAPDGAGISDSRE
jgi:hypothetical protein